MRFIILLLLATMVYCENAPIARLNDSAFANNGTPVYDVIDPVTQRRFLVVITDNGVAMIEATPVKKEPEPVKVMVVQVPPEQKYWEEATSYSFGDPQKKSGWELKSMSVENGMTVYHLRRKNPLYKGPKLEDGPIEK